MDQAVVVEPARAVLLLEVLADLLQEVGRHRVAALPAGGENDGLRHLVGGHLLRDVAFLRHAPQRVVAPLGGRIHVDQRADARRALDDAGDDRGLA